MSGIHKYKKEGQTEMNRENKKQIWNGAAKYIKKKIWVNNRPREIEKTVKITSKTKITTGIIRIGQISTLESTMTNLNITQRKLPNKPILNKYQYSMSAWI